MVKDTGEADAKDIIVYHASFLVCKCDALLQGFMS